MSDDNEVVRSEFVPPPLAIWDQLVSEWGCNPLEQSELPDEDEPGTDVFAGGLLP